MPDSTLPRIAKATLAGASQDRGLPGARLVRMIPHMDRKRGIDLTTLPAGQVVAAVCSPAEWNFSQVLKKALRSKALILVKVPVLQVIQLRPTPGDPRRDAFWRDYLGNATFDYVICSKQTLAPLLAVELDGDEPLRRGSATRDVAKSTLATRTGFPLVRIEAHHAYTPEALRAKLIADWKLAKKGPLPAEMA